MTKGVQYIYFITKIVRSIYSEAILAVSFAVIPLHFANPTMLLVIDGGAEVEMLTTPRE